MVEGDVNLLVTELGKERKSPEKIIEKVAKNMKKNNWSEEKINDFLEKLKLALEKKAEYITAFKKDWKEKLIGGLKVVFIKTLDLVSGGIAGSLIDEIIEIISQ